MPITYCEAVPEDVREALHRAASKKKAAIGRKDLFDGAASPEADAETSKGDEQLLKRARNLKRPTYDWIQRKLNDPTAFSQSEGLSPNPEDFCRVKPDKAWDDDCETLSGLTKTSFNKLHDTPAPMKGVLGIDAEHEEQVLHGGPRPCCRKERMLLAYSPLVLAHFYRSYDFMNGADAKATLQPFAFEDEPFQDDPIAVAGLPTPNSPRLSADPHGFRRTVFGSRKWIDNRVRTGDVSRLGLYWPSEAELRMTIRYDRVPSRLRNYLPYILLDFMSDLNPSGDNDVRWTRSNFVEVLVDIYLISPRVAVSFYMFFEAYLPDLERDNLDLEQMCWLLGCVAGQHFDPDYKAQARALSLDMLPGYSTACVVGNADHRTWARLVYRYVAASQIMKHMPYNPVSADVEEGPVAREKKKQGIDVTHAGAPFVPRKPADKYKRLEKQLPAKPAKPDDDGSDDEATVVSTGDLPDNLDFGVVESRDPGFDTLPKAAEVSIYDVREDQLDNRTDRAEAGPHEVHIGPDVFRHEAADQYGFVSLDLAVPVRPLTQEENDEHVEVDDSDDLVLDSDEDVAAELGILFASDLPPEGAPPASTKRKSSATNPAGGASKRQKPDKSMTASLFPDLMKRNDVDGKADKAAAKANIGTPVADYIRWKPGMKVVPVDDRPWKNRTQLINLANNKQPRYVALAGDVTLDNIPPIGAHLEDCEVLGIYQLYEAKKITKAALHALWPDTFNTGGSIHDHRMPYGRPGLVQDEEDDWYIAVVHNRYLLCGSGYLRDNEGTSHMNFEAKPRTGQWPWIDSKVFSSHQGWEDNRLAWNKEPGNVKAGLTSQPTSRPDQAIQPAVISISNFYYYEDVVDWPDIMDITRFPASMVGAVEGLAATSEAAKDVYNEYVQAVLALPLDADGDHEVPSPSFVPKESRHTGWRKAGESWTGMREDPSRGDWNNGTASPVLFSRNLFEGYVEARNRRLANEKGTGTPVGSPKFDYTQLPSSAPAPDKDSSAGPGIEALLEAMASDFGLSQEFRKQLHSLVHEYSELRSTTAQLEKEKEELETDNASLQQRSQAISKEKAALDEDNAKKQALCNDLRADIDRMKLDAGNGPSDEDHSRIQELKDECDRLRRDNSELEAQRKSTSDIESERENERDQLLKDKADLETYRNGAEEVKAALQTQNSNLQAANAREKTGAESARKAKEEAARKALDLQRELDELQKKAENDAASHGAKINEISTRLQEVQKQHTLDKREVERLGAEAIDLKTKLDTAQTNGSLLREENTVYAEDLSSAREAEKKSKQAEQNLQKQVGDLRNDLASANEAAEKSRRAEEVSKTELNNLRGYLQSAGDAADQSRRDAGALRTELERLREVPKSLGEAAHAGEQIDLIIEVEKLRKLSQEQGKANAELTTGLQSEREGKEESQKRVDFLEAELDKLNKQSQQDPVRRLEAKIDGSSAELLEAVRNSNAELHGNVQNSHNQILAAVSSELQDKVIASPETPGKGKGRKSQPLPGETPTNDGGRGRGGGRGKRGSMGSPGSRGSSAASATRKVPASKLKPLE